MNHEPCEDDLIRRRTTCNKQATCLKVCVRDSQLRNTTSQLPPVHISRHGTQASQQNGKASKNRSTANRNTIFRPRTEGAICHRASSHGDFCSEYSYPHTAAAGDVNILIFITNSIRHSMATVNARSQRSTTRTAPSQTELEPLYASF
jgi:hypothetical protein